MKIRVGALLSVALLLQITIVSGDLLIENADTIWNSSIVPASEDATNSSDALPQNLSNIFIINADTIWNSNIVPASEDVTNSSDALPQNLSNIFIINADTIWNSSIVPAPHSPLPLAKPVITSPLIMSPYYSIYAVGDTITAQFTITNKGTAPFVLKVLTVGGREPNGKVVDFDWQRNLKLDPGESHNYVGNLILPDIPGIYYFFATYQMEDGNWNTAIDLAPGLSDDDRAKRITVAESVIGTPREFVFEAVHLSSEDYTELSKIMKEILTQEKLKLSADDKHKLSLINDAIVLTYKIETEDRNPKDPVREGALTESQDFWLTKVGTTIVGLIVKQLPPGTGEALKQYGFDIAEALYLKNLGFVRMKQSGIGELNIQYRGDKEGAIVTYYGPNGAIFISTHVKSKWVLSPISLIRKQLYLPDSESYSVYYKVGNDIVAKIKSPGEIRVYDSQNRVTGLVNGE